MYNTWHFLSLKIEGIKIKGSILSFIIAQRSITKKKKKNRNIKHRFAIDLSPGSIFAILAKKKTNQINVGAKFVIQ